MIGKNTQKSFRDFQRTSFTLTPMKNHRLKFGVKHLASSDESKEK